MNDTYEFQETSNVAERDSAREYQTQETYLKVVEMNSGETLLEIHNLKYKINKLNIQKHSDLLDDTEIFHDMNNREYRERVEHVEEKTEFSFVEPIPEEYAEDDENHQEMIATGKLNFLIIKTDIKINQRIEFKNKNKKKIKIPL